jgi:outer membrane protein assembly factor BamA
MEKRLLGTLFACLAVAGVGCAAAEFPLDVTSITIEGYNEIKADAILSAVGFCAGDLVTEENVRTASQAIYDLGWFSEVLPRVSDDGSIVFSVTENPVVEEFEITGNINRRIYSLFGAKLFDAAIVSTGTIRRILRENDVKKGQILHLPSLKTALEKIVEKYSDNGYLLIAIGDVKPEPILKISIVEARVVHPRGCGHGIDRPSSERATPEDGAAARHGGHQEVGILLERRCSAHRGART